MWWMSGEESAWLFIAIIYFFWQLLPWILGAAAVYLAYWFGKNKVTVKVTKRE